MSPSTERDRRARRGLNQVNSKKYPERNKKRYANKRPATNKADIKQFQRAKQIASIRAGGKNQFLTSMRDSKGDIVREDEALQTCSHVFTRNFISTRREAYSDDGWGDRRCEIVPEVTSNEVKTCLAIMAKKKAQDSRGVVREMLQRVGPDVMAAIAKLLTDILDPNAEPPKQWRDSKFLVLFKKGSHQDPGNYRIVQLQCCRYYIKCLARWYARVSG